MLEVFAGARARRSVLAAVSLSLLTVAPATAARHDAQSAQGRGPGHHTTAGGADSAAGADRAYGRLPLAFVRDGRSYVARTTSGSVTLRRGAATVVPSWGRRAGTAVRIGLVGGARVAPAVQRRLPGVVNDLRGADRLAWRTGLPTFGRIRYAEVYPGIDLDYHGTSGTLEYDFRLAPGADPGRIRVDFHGAPLRLTRSGALVVGHGTDRLRQAAPVAFQPSTDGRDPVAARFVLRGHQVGFELGAYDPTRPLVIDPLVLSYGTLLGGSDEDRVNDIAVDSTGAAYLAGYTVSANFPTTAGAYDTSRSGIDAIVTKLDPTGTALLYSTLLGGSGTDFADTVAVDVNGQVVVAGQTVPDTSQGSTPFPTTGGAYVTSNDPGYGDAFVTKLNAAGASLVFSSVFGGTYREEARAVALDTSGAVYVGGYTQSTQNAPIAFPTSSGAYQAGPGGTNDDGFVTKLDTASGGRVWSTFLGGIGQDAVNGIDVDSLGRAYVTGFAAGNFNGNGFPTTASNRFAQVESNGTDAFLTRFSASGSSIDYSTGIGASSNGQSNNGSDFGYAVVVPTDGVAYIAGATRNGSGPNGDFPLKHEYQGRPGGCCFAVDGFVAKFDTTAAGAASLLYSTLLGGNGEDSISAIDVDSAGNAYVGGTTYYESGAFYPTTPDELGGGLNRGRLFVTKLVQSGSAAATLGFSTTIQSTSYTDSVGGVVHDGTSGAVYVGGTTWGGNPTTSGSYQTTPQGARDGFVTKILYSAVVDTTPPDTTITSGPGNGTTVSSASVTFGFSSTENPSTFECSYDGAAFAACSSPGPGATGLHTRTLANGAHTFSVRARDAATNVDPSPATRTFNVNVAAAPPPGDTAPPQTTVTKAPPATVTVKKSATVKIEFASTEAGSTFTCQVDGGPAKSCSSPATFKLAKGKHTILIAATDAAGNTDATPATVKVTVKKKKPKKK